MYVIFSSELTYIINPFFSLYRILVGKSGGKREVEGPRRRWDDIIKMNLRKLG
jgi:hypothetical protein